MSGQKSASWIMLYIVVSICYFGLISKILFTIFLKKICLLLFICCISFLFLVNIIAIFPLYLAVLGAYCMMFSDVTVYIAVSCAVDPLCWAAPPIRRELLAGPGSSTSYPAYINQPEIADHVDLHQSEVSEPPPQYRKKRMGEASVLKEMPKQFASNELSIRRAIWWALHRH